MASDREFENKFILEEEKLGNVLGLVNISEIVGFTNYENYEVNLLHEYFDTKDYILAKAHASYRHSDIEGNDKFRITFKKEETPGDLSNRLELKTFLQKGSYLIGSVSCDYLYSDLSPVVEAKKITGDERVKLAITVINRRTAIKFKKDDVVLEIGVDKVAYIAPNFKTKNDYELEVEIIEGNDIKALNKFSQALAIIYELKPSKDSKYIRGLKLHGLLA